MSPTFAVKSQLLRLSLLSLAAFTATSSPGCAQNAALPNHPDAPWRVIMSPKNSLEFGVYKGSQHYATVRMLGWGPNWQWLGLSAKQRAANGVLEAITDFEPKKGNGEVVHIALQAQKSAANTVTFNFTLAADKDVPLTQIVVGVMPDDNIGEGEATAALEDGAVKKLPLNFAGKGGVGMASKVALNSKTLGEMSLAFSPARSLSTDKSLRIGLAADKFTAGNLSAKMTMTLPGEVAFLASDSELASLTKSVAGPDWFPFKPTQNLGPSALGFEDWLEKPAGKHGGVRMVGDHFEFADKTPVKFWGTNLSYAFNAPAKAEADFTAARFAKWGVNSVRMHKFQGVGWAGIGDPNDGTKTTADGQDRLDYFTSQLTNQGIYYGWSHVFGFEVRPANREKLLAYDEILKSNKKGSTYALVNFAEDVQDLLIEWTVNLLKHKNPYTGKTYAQDPALSYIELQNEDDIFFYTSARALDGLPTYKKRFNDRFNEWLAKKYGTTDALRQAWSSALAKNETLEAKSVTVQTGPWFFGSQNLPSKQGGERQRLLDNAAFLHEEQNSFYSRFVKAIRDAGYEGPLVGSPWQAPPMLPHYNNLRSDALVGVVDRHNYDGGNLFDTLLDKPGNNLLSSGLQQVAGHPFAFSEWIHVYPSLYSADGPPLIAAYGLGLQGWDASYQFNSRSAETAFSESAGHLVNGLWNVDVPTQIGQYPLLARMVARGDVKQGDVISTRRVSPQNLASGEFNFTDTVEQAGDTKTFGGSVPAKALAAGRCLVEFTETTQPSNLPKMEQYEKGSAIHSNTGQLMWDSAQQGYFTINTPGTKAIVGFADGKECQLDGVTMKVSAPYASLILTAADKGATLATTKRALISMVGRNADTNMKYFEPDATILDERKGPIMLEPVKASIVFAPVAGRTIAAVNILDHDGVQTGRTVPVSNGSFTLDGARDKALYYEVVFK